MKAGNASDPGSLKRDCEIALEKCHVLGYTCHVGLLYPNCQQKTFAHHRADFPVGANASKPGGGYLMTQQTNSIPHKKWLLISLLAITLAVICCLALAGRYLWIGGQLVSRTASFLDLRDEELTLSDYTRLRQKLPQCSILWSVPLSSGRYPSDSAALPVRGLTAQDAEMLEYFPDLELLDAKDCADYTTIGALLSRRPELICEFPLAGETVLSDAAFLQLSDVSFPELRGALPLLTKLERLELTGTLPAGSDLRELLSDYPGVEILWEVPFHDKVLSSDITSLDVSSIEMDYPTADALISLLPRLEEVTMRGCGLTDEEMLRLAGAYPQTFFIWDMEVAGRRFSTDSTELDISGQQVSGPEEIESILPYFRRLERVNMSGCGLDDETMDALNRRHEDIRFVWTVKIRDFDFPTDSIYFYPWKMDHEIRLNTEDLYPLRYCTDLVCIDIGHMWGVETCEWAAFMPELRYLILGETRITDLSPLSNCKKLAFLELFTIPATDYSPLVECTGLEDLNLGRTYGDPTPLTKMTWLKNLWWANVDGTYGLPCSNAKAVLTEALPNTRMRFDIAHPTAGGWRQLPNYFAMRDLMGMFYLT